jgi:hypothetical protein
MKSYYELIIPSHRKDDEQESKLCFLVLNHGESENLVFHGESLVRFPQICDFRVDILGSGLKWFKYFKIYKSAENEVSIELLFPNLGISFVKSIQE